MKYEVEIRHTVEARDGRTTFVRKIDCVFPIFIGLELDVDGRSHVIESIQYSPKSGEVIAYLQQFDYSKNFTLDYLRDRFLSREWEEDSESLELYSEQEQS
jgi:hypothetical protein